MRRSRGSVRRDGTEPKQAYSSESSKLNGSSDDLQKKVIPSNQGELQDLSRQIELLTKKKAELNALVRESTVETFARKWPESLHLKMLSRERFKRCERRVA